MHAVMSLLIYIYIYIYEKRVRSIDFSALGRASSSAKILHLVAL